MNHDVMQRMAERHLWAVLNEFHAGFPNQLAIWEWKDRPYPYISLDALETVLISNYKQDRVRVFPIELSYNPLDNYQGYGNRHFRMLYFQHQRKQPLPAWGLLWYKTNNPQALEHPVIQAYGERPWPHFEIIKSRQSL